MARVFNHWPLEVSDPVSERRHWKAVPGRSVAGWNDRMPKVQKPIRRLGQRTPGTKGFGFVLAKRHRIAILCI